MTNVQSHHHTCNRSESNGHTEIHQAEHHIDFRPTPIHTLGTIIPRFPKPTDNTAINRAQKEPKLSRSSSENQPCRKLVKQEIRAKLA